MLSLYLNFVLQAKCVYIYPRYIPRVSNVVGVVGISIYMANFVTGLYVAEWTFHTTKFERAGPMQA